MNNHSAPNDPDVLDGWKDIADYIGKSVRTAQRWRQEFGMPVHRLGGREGENVYAFRSELDAWRRQTSRLGGIGTVDPEAANHETRGAEPAAIIDGARPHRLRTILAGTAAILLFAVLAYAGWTALGRGALPRTPAPGAPPTPDRQPARWVVVGDEFRFYNAAGDFLWRYVPGPPLDLNDYEGHTSLDLIPPPASEAVDGTSGHTSVTITDLDGDGRREVLLVANAVPRYVPSTLYCLDETGRERWTFRAGDPLVFGEKYEGRPRGVQFVAVSKNAGGTSSIWISAEHQTDYPTMVYRLDPDGNVLGRFGSNGRVGVIRFMPRGDRQLVLLGGVNNERKMAAVAVLDAARFGGAAPAETSEYRCRNCPPGELEAYLLFPPTELSRLTGGMPHVREIVVHPSGEVTVSVSQSTRVLSGDSRSTEANTIYLLDAALKVRDAEFYSQFITLHDHYAAAGRFDHRFDPARENGQLWPVLRWTGSGYDRITGPER